VFPIVVGTIVIASQASVMLLDTYIKYNSFWPKAPYKNDATSLIFFLIIAAVTVGLLLKNGAELAAPTWVVYFSVSSLHFDSIRRRIRNIREQERSRRNQVQRQHKIAMDTTGKCQTRINRARVRRILRDDWNPIGLDPNEAEDEYDAYADKIYVMLMHEGASEQTISSYLFKVVIERIGLPDSKRLVENSSNVAKLLVNARSEFESS
jgi:hypothetical protein